MALKDVKYNATADTAAPDPNVIEGGQIQSAPQDYGIWDLEFSTTGSYDNFINFINDLEHNLRIVDISSIDFSSDVAVTAGIGAGVGVSPNSQQIYQYKFTIKTYWLKN